MKTYKKNPSTALALAYRYVTKLGYTHAMLMRANACVNYPTLRNIRDGKPLKNVTERFYLKLFVGLINDYYVKEIACGGKQATQLLIAMKNILLAHLE